MGATGGTDHTGKWMGGKMWGGTRKKVQTKKSKQVDDSSAAGGSGGSGGGGGGGGDGACGQRPTEPTANRVANRLN